MTKSQEELERIIREHSSYHYSKNKPLEAVHWQDYGKLASAILSANYVKLSDVRLDEEKILSLVVEHYLSQTIDDCETSRKLAQAIHQTTRTLFEKGL